MFHVQATLRFCVERDPERHMYRAKCNGSTAGTKHSLVFTVLALKSGYYVGGEKATLISAADDIGILAYVKAMSGSQYLAG
jgi:hypothetical protein